MNTRFHLNIIRKGMQEALRWYEVNLGTANSFVMRSPELNPGQALTDSKDRQVLVDMVRAKRSRLLTGRTPKAAELPKEGNLLIYYPDLTLSDGAAQLASEGFFDADNEPPWDTWVFCGRYDGFNNPEDYGTFLLSCIPRDFRHRVNRGIQINPERCLEWAKESRHPFVSELRRSGILL